MGRCPPPWRSGAAGVVLLLPVAAARSSSDSDSLALRRVRADPLVFGPWGRSSRRGCRATRSAGSSSARAARRGLDSRSAMRTTRSRSPQRAARRPWAAWVSRRPAVAAVPARGAAAVPGRAPPRRAGAGSVAEVSARRVVVARTRRARAARRVPALDNPARRSTRGRAHRQAAPFLALALLAAAAALVVRFRRSHGIERQQMKWLAFAAACGGCPDRRGARGWPSLGGADSVTGSSFARAHRGVPVAAGIAILRHRLYDIDVVIRRTLVYGALTATLAPPTSGTCCCCSSCSAAESDIAIAGPLWRWRRCSARRCAIQRSSTGASTAAATTRAHDRGVRARLRDEVELDTLERRPARRRARDDAAGTRLAVAAGGRGEAARLAALSRARVRRHRARSRCIDCRRQGRRRRGVLDALALASCSCGSVGALVASRRPPNPIGWLFCSRCRGCPYGLVCGYAHLRARRDSGAPASTCGPWVRPGSSPAVRRRLIAAPAAVPGRPAAVTALAAGGCGRRAARSRSALAARARARGRSTSSPAPTTRSASTAPAGGWRRLGAGVRLRARRVPRPSASSSASAARAASSASRSSGSPTRALGRLARARDHRVDGGRRPGDAVATGFWRRASRAADRGRHRDPAPPALRHRPRDPRTLVYGALSVDAGAPSTSAACC